MTTTINNEHKELNFLSEREQSQACLNSAEHEKNQGRKVLNVPNLRFPEFQGEWITYKIKDVLSIGNGRDYKHLSNGEIPVFGTGGYMTSVDECLYDGETTFIGRKGSINKPFYYNGKFWPVDTLFYTHSFNGITPKFTYCLFQTINWLKYNEASGVPSLSKDTIEKIKIKIPGLEEQNKIAKLMFALDVRITTQNKIIDDLQSLIKGLEDNLLDNPLWEKTYLRSFMQFFPTNSLSWEQLSYKEGGIRNLHYGLIHGFQTRGINSASLPMIKNEAVPKQYILCQVGDVAFADASEDTGEIAKSVEFVNTIEGDTICGLHTIHGRDIKNRTVVGFKGFAFNSRYFHNQIKRLAQGTKVFSITANNLSSCYVYLPDLETQKAIVKLLKAYETQLIVSRKTLKQYEKQKQYLLRQMFI